MQKASWGLRTGCDTMIQPHIRCREEDVAEIVLLPGDPERVTRAAQYLDEYREVAFNREFKTVTGKYKGVPVSITSTGIGGASAAIALEELIACGAKKFIRIGSAGAVQKGIEIGDLIIVDAAVREDGASRMYVDSAYPAAADHELLESIRMNAQNMGIPFHVGVVRSHDSFYIDEEEQIMQMWSKKGVLASDMETAALFVVGRLRGVKVASILNNVVKYGEDVKEGIDLYVDSEKLASIGEENEIRLALEAAITI